MIRKIVLSLGDRSSEIFIGHGATEPALRSLSRRHPELKRAFVIADRNVAVQTRKLSAALSAAGWRVVVFSVRASEPLKDFGKIYPFYAKLLAAGADRNSVIFGVGGGVIGDTAGFIASTFMRGIAWVSVPTTLLAQVDSSIGGKTGVNHAAAKNLIGTIHQPLTVICEPSALRSLPLRDRVSGLGEMLKYGFIFDAKFLRFLRSHWSKILSLGEPYLTQSVAKCVALKVKVVQRDEFDRKGVRETLNFGHTVGHAIETAAGYGRFRHGEAVVLGMRAALKLSLLRGHLNAREHSEWDDFLRALPVPRIPNGITTNKILSYVRFDKKSDAGRVRFVLLDRVGRTRSDREVSAEELKSSVEWVRRS